MKTSEASPEFLIKWPCYEPAGYRMQISEVDLVQHVVLIGSTGSGKSTLLIDAMQQLIAVNSWSASEKIGLLILDAKADDLITRVRETAQHAGRLQDLQVFGPQGTHALNLFNLQSYDDVDRVTEQVMLGADNFGPDNAYWWQSCKTMISAAFTLLVASGRAEKFEDTVDFMRRWFLSPVTPGAVVDLVHQLSEDTGKQHPLLALAIDQVALWRELDSRTRSNLQSCLLTVLRPLLSPAADRCFNAVNNSGTPAQAATLGKLSVVSVNAMREPHLAGFVFRLASQMFFDEVQQRGPGRHRLCGLFADELPLVATPTIANNLSTIRSKRAFLCAATQGWHAISERIGVGLARSLFNNFNTTVYLRSREAETATQAFVALGVRREPLRRRPKAEETFLATLLPPSTEPATTEVPVCPLGTLGQLAPHQAFAVYANGKRTEAPLWFVPWFERPTPSAQPEVHPKKTSAAHQEQLMTRAGFRLRWSPMLVLQAAAFQKRRRRKTLQRVREFFLHKCCLVPEGLENLPEAWLAALPGILWSSRKPHWTKLPYFIRRVSVADGLLILQFAQELPESSGRLTAWDQLRIQINANIYPNRSRELSPWHKAQLWRHHPELRPALKLSRPEIS